MRRGIFTAKTGKSLDNEAPKYASDTPHLMVNLTKTPPHLDILTMAGGTALSFTAGVPATQTEILRTIDHGLKYTPEVLVYFLAYSYDGSVSDSRTGLYAADGLIYSGSAGTVADSVYASVDGTSIRIIHELADFGIGTYTSDANRYVIKVKYYILSKPARTSSYTTRQY